MGPTPDQLASAGIGAPGSDGDRSRRRVEPTPGAVRKADFYERGSDTDGDAPLTCRECRYEFMVPADWCNDHRGEHVGCPGCSLSSRIPADPNVAGIARD